MDASEEELVSLTVKLVVGERDARILDNLCKELDVKKAVLVREFIQDGLILKDAKLCRLDEIHKRIINAPHEGISGPLLESINELHLATSKVFVEANKAK